MADRTYGIVGMPMNNSSSKVKKMFYDFVGIFFRAQCATEIRSTKIRLRRDDIQSNQSKGTINPTIKMTIKLSNLISLKVAERSEAKSAKQSFASKMNIRKILTRSFASRFYLRYDQPFLSKIKGTINRSLYAQGLTPRN